MKKKKFIFLLAIVAPLVIFNSCVTLDEEPEGLLSPDTFFQTEADFDAALIGVTAPLWGGWGAYDFDIGTVHTPGSGADDIGSSADAFVAFERFNPDPNNAIVANIWKIHYATINNANALINNKDNASGISEEKLNALVGQAQFWRAFAYFQLTQYFGEVPIITTENQPNADIVGQSPIVDIYDVIIKDLMDAEIALPTTFPEKIRPNKWAAKSLLSKVYLTKAGWPLKDASALPLAATKAKEVIDSGVYALETDFKDLWLEVNNLTNSEYIFFFKGLDGFQNDEFFFGSHYHHSSRSTKEGGWANWFSEATFFNAFPDGYRKDISFTTSWPDGTSFPDDVSTPFAAKYRDAGVIGYDDTDLTGVPGDGRGTYVHMRYADVLLIYAEATGSTAAGVEALNKVRRRANNLDINTPNPSVDWPTVGPADFDRAVIDERAWELAFEDKRWFDLVRKEMLVEVKGAEYPHISQKHAWLAKPANEVAIIDGLEQNTY